MSDAVRMGLLLPHIPLIHLLGSRKSIPLHLGSIPPCAQVPEGLAVGDQSSVLHCWAGAMSRAAFAHQPSKQQGCPGALSHLFPHSLDLMRGVQGCLDGTGVLWVSWEEG